MDHFSKIKMPPGTAPSRRPAQAGFLKRSHALVLAALTIVVGVLLANGPPMREAGSGPAAPQSGGAEGPREVDFGLAELNPGLPTPITSYKVGGNMKLYAGDELHYQVQGDPAPAAIELHVGTVTQTLVGSQGKVLVAVTGSQPERALMVAQGGRVSLPGNAPPKVSVKVQIMGAPRPK